MALASQRRHRHHRTPVVGFGSFLPCVARGSQCLEEMLVPTSLCFLACIASSSRCSFGSIPCASDFRLSSVCFGAHGVCSKEFHLNYLMHQGAVQVLTVFAGGLHLDWFVRVHI
ncbi:hypothetical protein R1flu_021893 [Riccia fluitans]|uniref:Uncharacterized protein n=1 Tax=Riccia fluitans TaxID=41844 RepID=A0ABD1ZS95_9MARC